MSFTNRFAVLELVGINRYIEEEVVACIVAKTLLCGNASLDLQKHIISVLQAGANGMYICLNPVPFNDLTFIQVPLGQAPDRDDM